MSQYHYATGRDMNWGASSGVGLERSTVSVRLQGISRSRLRREGSRGEPRLGLVLAHASVLECCTNALRQHRENLRSSRYSSSAGRSPTLRRERRSIHAPASANQNDLLNQMGAMSLSFVAESTLVEKDAEEPLVIVNTVELSADGYHSATEVDSKMNSIHYNADAEYLEETSSESSGSDISSTTSDEEEDEDEHEDELPDYSWAYSPRRKVTIDISRGSQEQGATLATLCYSWDAVDNGAC